MAGGKKVTVPKSVYKYVPVYPIAQMDEKYHYRDEDGVLKIRNDLFTLARSVDDLKEYLEKCKGKIIAVDTETTGLTYGVDQIVGFSVSVDRYSGIYVPLRHKICHKIQEKTTPLGEDGKPLLTKAGKPRTKTITKLHYEENPANLPVEECLDLLYHTMRYEVARVIMHNSEFDMTMIQQENPKKYDMFMVKTFDTMILTYIYDAENKMWNKLKEASKIVLGRFPMKFYEALGTEKNFQTVDLEIAYPYACSDTANTLGIYEELYPKVNQLLGRCPKPLIINGKPYNVVRQDNVLLRAFTDYYSHVDLLVNRETAVEYKNMIDKQLEEVEEKIYKYFKKGKFNLSPSSKEFKDTMEEHNIITGLFTETGGVSYSKPGIEEMGKHLISLKNVIDNFDKVVYTRTLLNKTKSPQNLALCRFIEIFGKQHFSFKYSGAKGEDGNVMYLKGSRGETVDRDYLYHVIQGLYNDVQEKMTILKAIQQRSSLIKALTSYVTKLTEVDKCHMRYRLHNTASGRLSSGNGSKNDTSKNHYFIDLNAQNLTKPKSAIYKAEKTNSPNSILGWDFELVTNEFYNEHQNEFLFVEGSNPVGNIRNCLVAPEGRYIASLDYSAQEYRVLAILSGDRKMIDNFKRGLDPHTATAYSIWGEENYCREYRKKAKGANFCINYGGGAYTLANTLNIPLEEAQGIIEGYEKAFKECVAWKRKQISNTINEQRCVTYNAFGRPRQFASRWGSASKVMTDKTLDYIPFETREKVQNGMQKAVERRVISHIIQGCCGDICRMDLINLYNRFFRHGNRDPHIDFYSTVHDEINFSIDKDYVIDYVREIDDIMTITMFSRELPIVTSIDLGYTLGVLFPFEWEDKERTNLIPLRM